MMCPGALRAVAVGTKVLDENFSQATAADIGLTRGKSTRPDRCATTRDGYPAWSRKILDEKLAAGEERTRADVKRVVVRRGRFCAS
jgi:hypothetical protein